MYVICTTTIKRGEQGENSGAVWGQVVEPLYLDAMLGVEVCGAQAGVEAVAQTLQQPHGWEQLTFVLKQAAG